MSNQTTPQASDLPLPLVFNDAAKEDTCASRWNACVECADGESFCETFGFDKAEAESRARLVVQAVNERAEMLAAVQPTCPPSRLPFDLDKALKGERLVTRSGRKSRKFFLDRPWSSYPYTAQFEDGAECNYTKEGRDYVCILESSWDLFLAGEEGKEAECEECSCGAEGIPTLTNDSMWYVHCGSMKHGISTSAFAEKWRAIKQWNDLNSRKSPPPPETETQPQPLASMLPTPQEELEAVKAANEVERKAQETETQRQAQSEIDRQIEVMMASREGAIVERCHSGCEDEPTAIWSAHKPGERFNWQSFYYRIKPAETKPRVVWFIWDGSERLIGPFKCKQEIHPNWKQWPMDQEDLLSALKAAGIEAGKGDL